MDSTDKRIIKRFLSYISNLGINCNLKYKYELINFLEEHSYDRRKLMKLSKIGLYEIWAKVQISELYRMGVKDSGWMDDYK